MLTRIGAWYKSHGAARAKAAPEHAERHPQLSRRKIRVALAVLMALVFSKYFYLASLTSYYTFFLMSRFHLPVRSAQIHLFVFLGAVAAGTFIGGPVGDRIGRKYVIWCSILGILPFTLVLPYANLFWTACSAWSSAWCWPPHSRPSSCMRTNWFRARWARSPGLFFGLAFGMGGIGAAFWAGWPTHQHCVCLPGVLVSARDRTARRPFCRIWKPAINGAGPRRAWNPSASSLPAGPSTRSTTS